MTDGLAEAVVAEARRWLGTPYVHQCSARGQGADCLGLLRGVWREVIGIEPVQIPSYTPDWSECSHLERLWSAAKEHLVEVPVDPSRIGCVVLFRMRRDTVAKHVAILARRGSEMPTIIHAYSGKGVVETPLTNPWQRRIVAQFQYPNRGS
jgi:NlpC/P60 family putative phage cell wall peptidase